MIGLDTNVLLRYFVRDNPEQTSRVRQFLTDCRKSSELIFVSCTVVCELVWSLKTAYRMREAEILNAIEELLETESFVIEQSDTVRSAVHLARNHKGDLADYLIGLIGLEKGCRHTVTFDKALHSHPAFRKL